jgi:tRNA threonylcarbamoyladenosine modification (KEOPS) complex Cgi121 subunit
VLKTITQFRKHVIITGFRDVKIVDVNEFLIKIKKKTSPDTTVQFFDAEHVAGWEHLYYAVFNALLSMKQKRAISKGLGMEILLYASAQHQIKRATGIMGIKAKGSDIGVIIVSDKALFANQALSAISEQAKAQPDESVLELQDNKTEMIRKTFGITDEELNATETGRPPQQVVTDLIIERMALLSTKH